MDDQQLIAKAKADLTWLQKHERMIIVLLVLSAVCWLGNHWLNNSAAQASANYAELKKASDTAVETYKTTIDALTKQNVALAGSIAQRTVVLQQKQAEIKTMPLPEVSSTWQSIIGGQGDIVPRTDGVSGVAVSEEGTRRTVGMLEENLTLKANYSDEKTIADNTLSELNSCQAVIKADDTTHKAEVAELKAQARKSKKNWFIAGFVAGIATRLLAHF